MSDQQATDQPKALDVDFEETVAEVERDDAAREMANRKSGTLTMDINVSSPYKVYYEGKAFSISAENATGNFDILPKHHNFISLLKASTLTIRTAKGEEQKIDIGGGLIHVKADQARVFLDV